MKAVQEEIRPGYKLTKLGWIPSDWDFPALGRITKITSGGTPDRKEATYWNGNIPWVTTSLIKFNRIHQAVEFISESGLKNSSAKLFPKGTVLIALYGLGVTRGKSAILDIEASTNQACAAFLLNDSINSEYLFYSLTDNYHRIRRLSNIGSQDNLSGSLLKSIHIPLPDEVEQKAIAQVLSTWDKAIENLAQLITEKQQKKKALMQKLLTGKKRFPEYCQKHGLGRLKDSTDLKSVPSVKSTEIRDADKRDGGWKEVKLIDLFERVTRKNTEENSNVVTISAQRGFVRQTDFFKKSVASEILDNYFLVEHGEFCYNKSYSNGYPRGATKRLNDFDKAVVTTLYICFGIKDTNKTSGDFFEHFFEANLLDRGLTRIAHEGGRAHGLLNVTPSDFFNLQVTIPEHEEQIKISTVLNAANREIQLLNKKLYALKDQKKGLMQQLLTGKKRIKQ